MGNPVSRSCRVAASRAVTRDTPGKAGTNRERAGERGPVAVGAADRIGKKHSSRPRARGPAPPGVVPPGRNPRPAGRRGCCRAHAGPPVPWWATWISSTLSNWPAAWRASTHDRPGPAGAHGHHHTSLAGLGVQVEQVLDRADAVGHRHDVPAGGHGPLGHREVAGGGDASTTTSAAEGSGSSTASALSPSELATAARRRRSGSSTRTAGPRRRPPDAEPPGRRPRPHTRKRTVTDRYRRPGPLSSLHPPDWGRRAARPAQPQHGRDDPGDGDGGKRPSEQSHGSHLRARARADPSPGRPGVPASSSARPVRAGRPGRRALGRHHAVALGEQLGHLVPVDGVVDDHADAVLSPGRAEEGMTRPPQRVQLGPRDRKVMTVTGPSGVSTASTWANVRFRMRHCAPVHAGFSVRLR